MARVTNTPKRLARKRRLLKHAKGFSGKRKNLYKVMRETVHRAWQFAYRGRRLKKRDFRALWIVRIGAAARREFTDLLAPGPGAVEGEIGAQRQRPRAFLLVARGDDRSRA